MHLKEIAEHELQQQTKELLKRLKEKTKPRSGAINKTIKHSQEILKELKGILLINEKIKVAAQQLIEHRVAQITDDERKEVYLLEVLTVHPATKISGVIEEINEMKKKLTILKDDLQLIGEKTEEIKMLKEVVKKQEQMMQQLKTHQKKLTQQQCESSNAHP